MVIGITAIIKKKTDNEYSDEILSIIPPIIPANLFEIAEAKNQNPKINPISFLGESLLTYESPTGDRHNSPMVWKK